MDPIAPDLGVGLVGYAFMGAAHSHAWRTAPHFFDLPLRPASAGAVRTGPGAASPRPPRRLGWESTETDWTRLLARDDIDLVDVCTPGDTHAEIAIAALRGRQARALREAARQLGGRGAGDGRRRRPGRRPRRPRHGRLHLPPGARRRPGPPAGRAGPASATSGTSGRSTSRTGSPTRSRR